MKVLIARLRYPVICTLDDRLEAADALERMNRETHEAQDCFDAAKGEIERLTAERDNWHATADADLAKRMAAEAERDALKSTIQTYLKNFDPEGFGCACTPTHLCGPCSEAKRQQPLYAAIQGAGK